MKRTNHLLTIVLAALICTAANSQPVSTSSQVENNFGNKEWISNGLVGKIYALAENTPKLPDFDTMKSIGTIYTKEINVPNRSWTEGFPGVTDRFEWFGIEYNGNFKVQRAGKYSFTLNSDDGSKLFIDGKLIVDNDGLHSIESKSGEVYLDNSNHNIKIQYFQGPPTELGLQLFAQCEDQTPQAFPGNQFELSTPTEHALFASPFLISLYVFLFMLLLSAILRLLKKWRSRQIHPRQ